MASGEIMYMGIPGESRYYLRGVEDINNVYYMMSVEVKNFKQESKKVLDVLGWYHSIVTLKSYQFIKVG